MTTFKHFSVLVIFLKMIKKEEKDTNGRTAKNTTALPHKKDKLWTRFNYRTKWLKYQHYHKTPKKVSVWFLIGSISKVLKLNISILFIRVQNILQSMSILNILSKYDDFVHFSDLKALETHWSPPMIQNVM